MLYDLANDLHADFRKNGVADINFAAQRKSDVLVINGDTANHYEKTIKLLKHAAQAYRMVLVTLGNHEHYNTRRDVSVTEHYFDEKLQKKGLSTKAGGNVVYLNGDNFYRIEGTVFIGHTGWYNWRVMCPDFTPDAQRDIWGSHSSDSQLTYSFLPDELALAHALALEKQVAEFSADPTVDEIVIATHMAPRRECMTEQPWNRIWQALSGSYANTHLMQCLMVPDHKIRNWLYGHTHERRDFTIDGVRYINNARGYPSEETDWSIVQYDTTVI